MIIVPIHHFVSIFYLVLNGFLLVSFKYNPYLYSNNWAGKSFRYYHENYKSWPCSWVSQSSVLFNTCVKRHVYARDGGAVCNVVLQQTLNMTTPFQFQKAAATLKETCSFCVWAAIERSTLRLGEQQVYQALFLLLASQLFKLLDTLVWVRDSKKQFVCVTYLVNFKAFNN